MSVSVPLEQRGSPVCLPLPPPPPRPANRIVSMGDSSSASRPERATQSSDDSESRMTLCYPPRWTPVSLSCQCVGDSDERRLSSECVCGRIMELRPLVTRSSSVRPRPRALCSRKIVSDKGRKCRHTSCQRVSSVDSVLKPETPSVNVIDVLHRDQRTVCVSSNECSDSVRSPKDFKCHTFRSRRSGKCDVQFRFPMQRFCSAVLCSLVLLTALRPQLSMATPVPPSYPNSKDSVDAGSDFSKQDTGVDGVIKGLQTQTDIILTRVNTYLRNQFCVNVLYIDCPVDVPIDIGAFQFKKVPKKLGDTVEKDHFDEDKVDEALQNTHHNFQAYMIALQKLYDNQIPDEATVSEEYTHLRANIGKLLDELQILMKLRGVEPPPEVVPSEVADLSNPSNSSAARILHWGILVEAINGVEYFKELLTYLSSPQQSTKL